MVTKDRIMKALEQLPADASEREIFDEIEYIVKVERGLKEIDAGNTISHEDALARIRQWLK